MEHYFSWAACIHTSGQDILTLLWKWKVHYHLYRSLLLDHIPYWFHLVHIVTSYCLYINFSITPCILRSPKLYFIFTFIGYNFICSIPAMWEPHSLHNHFFVLPLHHNIMSVGFTILVSVPRLEALNRFFQSLILVHFRKICQWVTSGRP